MGLVEAIGLVNENPQVVARNGRAWGRLLVLPNSELIIVVVNIHELRGITDRNPTRTERCC